MILDEQKISKLLGNNKEDRMEHEFKSNNNYRCRIKQKQNESKKVENEKKNRKNFNILET